jgi:hypothetical protein
MSLFADLEASESIIEGRLHVFHGGRWLPVPSGGADDTPPEDASKKSEPAPSEPATTGHPPATVPPAEHNPDDGTPMPAPVHPVPEVPDEAAIQTADEGELRELHAALEAFRVEARERMDVDAVRQARAEMDRIAAEIARRRADEARRVEELAAEDQTAPVALPEPAPVLAGANASAAQLASIKSTLPGAQTPAVKNPPPVTPPRPRAALTAAAGNDLVSQGTEMTLEDLGRVLDRAKTGREGQAILASIPAFAADPDGLPELLSGDNGAPRNDRLIREAQDDWRARVREGRDPAEMVAGRTAAICGPLDIMREIPDAFVTNTPVADMFPSRPAGRGGWQFTRSGELVDVAGAVSLWNEANQAAVDPNTASTWKPCKTFVCPTAQSATVEAIVECVQFDNTLEMSNPERVRNLQNAVDALSARTYEGRILQRIDALSHPFRFTGDYGALPALIEAINSLVPQLTWWNRLEAGNYDLIVPPGVLNILAIDRANRAYGSEMDAGTVLQVLAAALEGVARVVVSLDPSLGGEPGTFMDPLPLVGVEAQRGAIPYISGGVYRMRLVDPAAAIYATTGEVNAGVLRDANMVRQNRTGYFTERFFMLEKNGPQPWANIDVKLCADGSRAGLVAPNGCLVS